MPQIEKAFYWRLNNIPKMGHLGSSVLLIGVTTATIGGVCASGALVVGLNQLLVLGEPWSHRVCISSGACGPISIWILAVAAFLIVNLVFFWYYRHWKKHMK